MREIVPITKPRGKTPLEVITAFRETFPQYRNEKISAAGRLDPMADGLLLLLIGDANKERRQYETCKKTYEFSVLLGITTDTYDILGNITGCHRPTFDAEYNFHPILNALIGEQTQAFPPYSSKPVLGKALYLWAREGRLNEITIPSKTIVIDDITLLKTEQRQLQELLQPIISIIPKVTGDFRQQEILSGWKKLTKTNETFPLITCRTTVSSGTYIRGLAHTLGSELGCGAIAYTITRVAVGDYTLADAISVDTH